MAPRSTRRRTTTTGPRWTRCTSRRSWIGSGRTCAAVRGTRSSTSPPWRRSSGSPHTCTPPSGASSLGPVWDELAGRFVDPSSGVLLPTWDEALDDLDADRAARPAHVVKLGTQLDYQGIIASAEDQVGKAIGYLTKYLVKDMSEVYGGPDEMSPAQARHLATLHEHVRWLPCSPTCCNWLRFGVEPKDAEPGMAPGECPSKAHDRHHLGIGGRRVLVSRQWTGKTLTEHKADRAAVVRQALSEAGVEMPQLDRCSATATTDDGKPRFIWSPVDPDDEDVPTYRRVMADSIAERIRWREQYEAAKQLARAPADDTRSATDNDPASSAA